MSALVIRFASLFLTALLVGTMFGIWLGFNPAALSASAYVEMQQNTIRALNVPLPALGLTCILLTAALAVLTRNNKPARSLLLTAVVLLIAAGLITRFANQPINAVVMAWSPNAPAANWTELRDSWWHWHSIRTAAAMLALALALLASVISPRGVTETAQAS